MKNFLIAVALWMVLDYVRDNFGHEAAESLSFVILVACAGVFVGKWSEN